VAIALTDVSPVIVGVDGGEELIVLGDFSALIGIPLRVHLGPNGDNTDPECTSGIPDQGNNIFALTDGKLRCYSPRVQWPAVPTFITVRRADDVDTGTLGSPVVEVLYAQYDSSVFSMRKMFPPHYLSGERSLDNVTKDQTVLDGVPASEGMLAAFTASIGGRDNDIGGLVMTRLTSTAAVGDSILFVESTANFPDSGVIGVGGIRYHYTSKLNNLFNGVTHIANGVSTPGAAVQHIQWSAVIDTNQDRSAIENLRRAMLVAYAETDDLDAVARNVGVDRYPFLGDDDVFREIVQAIAYNPRGSMFGLELAMDAMVGAGNYELYEDLESFPNTVFVRLIGVTGATAKAQGKAYLSGPEVKTAATDTTLGAIDEALISRGAVHKVFWTDEAVFTDTRLQKPSTPTQVEYPGDGGTAHWIYIGDVTEATQVLINAAPDSWVRVLTTVGTQNTDYERDLRIQPESNASLSMTVRRSAMTLSTDLRTWMLRIKDGARDIGLSLVWDTADEGIAFSNPQTGAKIGSTYPFTNNVFFEMTLRKLGNRIQAMVDGAVVMEAVVTDFPTTTDTKCEWGINDSTAGAMELHVKQVGIDVHTGTDYFAARGGDGVVAAGSENVDSALGDFLSGDVGKALRVSGSVITNSEGGNNNGPFEVVTFNSATSVEVQGKTYEDASVTAHPELFFLPTTGQQFQFPDDLGKKVVVSGSGIGNNGSFVISALYELDGIGGVTDLESYDSPIPQKTHIATLNGATFIAEVGLDYRIDPAFDNEASLDWVLSDAGTLPAGVPTLRQALPIAGGGYTRVLGITYSEVLSAGVLMDIRKVNVITVPSPIEFSYYPFYLSDPLGFVKFYLDQLTAAGVIAESGD